MQGKTLAAVYLLMALVAVRFAVRAFSEPWRWSLDQCAFLFFLLCWTVVFCKWGLVWWRGGRAGVQAEWLRVQDYQIALNEGVDRRKASFRWWYLLFWIGLALVLVLVFNLASSR